MFCKCINYEKLGFIVKGKSHEGKPAYETPTLVGQTSVFPKDAKMQKAEGC